MSLRGRSARRHLDARFARLRPLVGEPRPHSGWVRSIREALGMSTVELARRMGVTQQRISTLERAEVEGVVKLGSLERAAEALGCDLVYALVPRTSLEEAVRAQARRNAAAHLGRVSHTMRLEDAEVPPSDAQLDDLAAELIDRRGLWTDRRPIR